MRMKALQTFRGVEGEVRRGQEFDVATDKRVRELELRGRAIPVSKLPPPAPRPAAIKNEAANTGPLRSAGGRTGAAKRQSSLQAAPRPAKSNSVKTKKRGS